MSFDWNLAKTFLAVHDAGSLSAAARVLGQTQPTVSRQIAALETALGITLFERTGRTVVLTQSGIELLEHARSMASGANMVSLAASGQSQSIEGQVRITATEFMSGYMLPPILMKLALQVPLLEIDVIADNGVKDLVRREADIAIRHVPSDQPNLIMKRVRDQVMRFYASRVYLESRGQPQIDNLSDHQIISFADADQMLGYLVPAGLALTKANFRLSSSSQLAALEMARNHMGIIVLPVDVADKTPGLEPVLGDVDDFLVPTWLVTHSELKTSRRIRLVFDQLAEGLG